MRKIFIFTGLLILLLSSSVTGEEIVQLRPYNREYSLMGVTSPKATVSISSEFAGKLADLKVDVGDAVAADGKVALLDTTFVLLELEQNSLAQQETRRQLELENKNLKRYTTLITKNSTAQATYDETVAKTDLLELQLRSLINEENTLRQKLRRHTLLGPAGWLVMERYAEPGQNVSQGEPVLLLGNFEELVVSYYLSIEELRITRKTDQLTVQLPEINHSATASIFRVSPDIDAKARKRRVDLLIDGAGLKNMGLLGGGLRAQLILKAKAEAGLYLAPKKSLKSRYEAHWLTQADGKEVKVIVVGNSEDGKEAVISGKDIGPEQVYLLNP